MKKTCCDKCGKDVVPKNFTDEWETATNGMRFRVQVVGDYCIMCIRDSVISLVIPAPVEADKPSAETPVIMPAWEDLPMDHMNSNRTRWCPHLISDYSVTEYEYNLQRNALQSAQKPKGAV